MKKLMLYLHIPFCEKKCFYCDFLSAPASSLIQQEYVNMLQKEIEAKAPSYRNYRISSIFIGGGTPSSISEKAIVLLLEKLYQQFHVEPDAEITIECNPVGGDGNKFKTYRDAGINRLSLGVQSTQNKELELLGRIHTRQHVLKTYDLAQTAGFSNINLDLIYAFPGQSLPSWEKSLTTVVKLQPAHISVYHLLIEPGTPFFKRYRNDQIRRENDIQTQYLPDEKMEQQMQQMATEILAASGFKAYEISNYARPHRECRHNCGYWQRANYLGLGLGSASLVENVRFANTKALTEYLQGNIESIESEQLSITKQMEEYMFLGLRMYDGVSKQKFRESFKINIESIYANEMQKLSADALLYERDGRVFLTELGRAYGNYVMAQFLINNS